MPLPQALLPFKPYWLALILVYWALESPERVRAWVWPLCSGLAGDLLTGELLGEQALRLCMLSLHRSAFPFAPAFLSDVATVARRVRPVAQRPHAAADDPRLCWRAAAAGRPSGSRLSAGTLLWPCLFLLLDDLRARLRVHES